MVMAQRMPSPIAFSVAARRSMGGAYEWRALMNWDRIGFWITAVCATTYYVGFWIYLLAHN
jgi:hypothetical protein